MREILGCTQAPSFRLPDTISPRHYAIEIEPDLETGTFVGRVTIQLRILKPTQYIVFHALRLHITRADIEPEGGIISHPDIYYSPDQEAAYLKLESKLHAGSEAILTLRYGGRIAPPGAMGGLSSTPYQQPDGQLKLGFETMFEPTLARSVFPCFDEPDLKAEFLISMIVSADLTCLSNMEIDSVHPVESSVTAPKKRVTFDTSPKMSTYLVVMVAGYFNVLETNDFHVPIRVWAALDKDIDSAAYALEIAVKSMRAHEKNFGLKYPLPKLDMVAIPGHQGGMEHWGCVTYEERGLVLPSNPSEYNKLVSAIIISHELAHQWFGNIVTMKFWDSLWLNEAFAEWAAFLAVSEILPNFDAWSSFIASNPDTSFPGGLQAALELDSNSGSHAIQAPGLPAGAMFDSITYLKGCSIIRMLAEEIGKSLFLDGIKLYLERFKYANATTGQLWSTLSEVSGRDVGKIMAAWTENVGYPLLTVNEIRPTGEIVVSQSRFLQNGNIDSKAGPYPVSIKLKGPDGVTTHPLVSTETRIRTNLFKYKLNADLVGFYRVSYPISRIHKFGVQFAGDYLSTNDKVGIISDLAAVVATGSTSRSARLPDFLDFLFTIKNHVESLFVWREILGQMQKIRAAFLFEGDEVLRILERVKHQLLAHLIAKGLLKFKSSDTTKGTFLKSLLYGQLQEHPIVQKNARESWDRLLDGEKDALNPNIKRHIFDIVVSIDDTDMTWNQLKSIAFDGAYIHPGDPVTPAEAFASLGNSSKPDIIARTLLLITPSEGTPSTQLAAKRTSPFVVNNGARQSLLSTLQRHPTGAETSWRWLQDNWDVLQKSTETGVINGYSYISGALAGLATSAHLVQVEDFFAGKTGVSNKLILTQAMDIIRARSRLIDADRGELLKWAKRNGL
ncbi:peptidase family M1-domain-containing protein [Truncatella angustata]|uniref:Aminopeptidase n=1 Tax=Truncatella angustata TaxID=152316 RepID=A0A9P9A3T0_9PEZI|nr:peptidase family M1-domain-containing protein [Truncatella angustata]KAH6660468.1 peptidase family M1-domain-containing protein [Truncatella angustata]